MVAFGQQLIASPGEVTDAHIDELCAHGYSDEHIAEVIGLGSLPLLTCRDSAQETRSTRRPDRSRERRALA